VRPAGRADGINSKVSRQAFGDPKIFHTGLRVWLAWCDAIDNLQIIRPASIIPLYQASYFPMLHHGKDGFEWWC